jgi:hypothetical protein
VNNRTRLVFLGWTNLTSSEKAELVKKINEYEDMTPREKETEERFQESVKGVDLGPLSSTTCPCCGR